MDLMPATFEPPEAFDIEEAVMRSIAMTRTGGEFEVLVEASLDRVRDYLPSPIALHEAVSETQTRTWGTTDNPYWIASRIGALPFAVQVVKSESLKAAMREIGERMIAAGNGSR